MLWEWNGSHFWMGFLEKQEALFLMDFEMLIFSMNGEFLGEHIVYDAFF